MGAKFTTADPPPDPSPLVAMNEALMVATLRQHELTETAERLNAQLLVEIAAGAVLAAELADKARLLDLTHDAIIVRDMEGHVRYWNHGAEELYGWSREEALGKISHLLLQTEFFTPLEQLTEELHRTGRWIGELVHTNREGKRLTVLVRKTLDRDRDGHPVAVLENLTNITERKRAEEALLKSETRFRSAVGLVSSLIWTNNAPGMMEGEQPGWGNFTGQTPEEYRGYGWAKAVHPEDAQPTIEAWQAAVAEKRLFEFEHRVRRADGEWRRCSVCAVPLLSDDGTVLEWLGVHTDITERNRSQEALRVSEEFNRSIVESNRDCLKVLDCQGKLLMMAPLGQELLCIDDIGPYLGKSWIEFYEGEEREAARRAVEAAVAGETGHFTGFFRNPRGEAKWWDVLISPIRDAHGKTERLLAVSRDVTERRELEDSLVARAAELARADRSKDEFLAMLAHELRNPLAPLRNAAEILRTADAGADAAEEAQHILTRQLENMSRMIDDLLDVSRITEGKIELRPQPVALEAVLSAAANLARPGIHQRGQELTMALPAEPVFLHADATRLEQVFGNLLTNACKYGATGGHISLTTGRVASQDGEPPEVIVSVRDDGMGIAPEFLPHIFDLFVQATRSLDRTHGGLGIGLTLVQRLVKLHGGSVEARSEGLGHGSEFIVRLPILTVAAVTPPPPSPLPARDTPRRILIVDDNEDSARSMATLQRLRGHETRIAFTGPDAVAAAAHFGPEIVLLDIGLPGMDGYEVARHLRAMPALAGAFVVAMSGYGRPEDVALARAAGFDEYLVKPADLDLLRTWMRSRG